VWIAAVWVFTLVWQLNAQSGTLSLAAHDSKLVFFL
jgi:hypothetical protein